MSSAALARPAQASHGRGPSTPARYRARRPVSSTSGPIIGRVLRRVLRVAVVAALAVPLGAIWSFEAWFAPRSELWPRWTAHDPAATAAIDHAPWDRFLKTYVAPDADRINRVAYARVTTGDRAALVDYVDGLAGIAIGGHRRDQQLAYWINLYNALTVKLVLDYYPVASIHDIDISPGWFSNGPWDKKLLTIEGEAVSLNDIEHRILRPIWRDARIHYALNCASVGCPQIKREAFTADNTEALLNAAAREYVNHPRGARIENGRLIVSSIYVWFVEDFGDSDEGVIAHLRRHAGPDLLAALAGVERIDDFAYDWRLNDAPG